MLWQIALSLSLATFLLNSDFAFGQHFKKFDVESYPAPAFRFSQHDYPIGQFTVRIIQVKKKYESGSLPPSYCRAWLDVTKGNQILEQAYFGDIEPVGGHFGIFLPKRQPLPDYFLALKDGDYDGRLLLVSKDGSLTDLPGGWLFLTPDKRFIIGSHSSDDASLFVIDVARHQVVLDGEKLKLPDVGDWYRDKSGYFYTVLSDSGAPIQARAKTILIYRLSLKNLKVSKGAISAAELNRLQKVELVEWNHTSDCTAPK